MGGRWWVRWARWAGALGSVLLAVGCELQEVTLASPEARLVGEVYVLVGDEDDQITAFVHSTLGSADAGNLLVSTVTLTVEDTLEISLLRYPADECLLPQLVDVVAGVCFSAGQEAEDKIRPGDRVVAEIATPDGRRLRGATVIPADLELLRPRAREVCALPPGQSLPLLWNRSQGAWAYAAESTLWGLRDALAPQGIEVEADSVALLGLAISESDTTIVFPREFGIFSRFTLEQEVALALQAGMPRGVLADIAVAALDRNYVNWVRGGAFNPSGAVRVPSLQGDGTGVIASAVRRVVRVLGTNPGFMPGNSLPSCLATG